MSKKRAVANILAAALLPLFFASGFVTAEEFSIDAVFSGQQNTPFSFSAKPQVLGAVLYQSGESDAFSQPWNVAIVEGQNLDADITFEFSRRDESGDWSPWVAAISKRFDNGRFWARANFSLGNGSLRFRAVNHGVDQNSDVLIFHVEVVQNNEVGEQQNPGPVPPEIVLPSWIYTRKDWNAAAPRDPYALQVPVRITLHHSEGPQTFKLDESEREIRFIQDWHKNGRGWSDIGYHFLVDGAGNVFEGRPSNVVGANVKGFNDGNIGIVLMGNYEAPVSDKVTPAQLKKLVKLIRYLSNLYDIKIDDKTLRGHRDYEATLCPGDNVYTLLPTIRQLANKSAEPKPVPSVRLEPFPAARLMPASWDGR